MCPNYLRRFKLSGACLSEVTLALLLVAYSDIERFMMIMMTDHSLGESLQRVGEGLGGGR